VKEVECCKVCASAEDRVAEQLAGTVRRCMRERAMERPG